MEILDFHTHSEAPGSLLSLDIADAGAMPEDSPVSLGLHPWNTGRPDAEALMEKLEEAARSPQVVAIGEAGLDALRGAPLDRQEELFRRQIRLSEQLGKPLVIHLVKALDRLLRIRREERPRQPWILHGFRGNANIVRQLLRLETGNPADNPAAPIYFSLGPKFNPEAARAIPLDRLLIETDASGAPVDQVLDSLSANLDIPAPALERRLTANSARIFPKATGCNSPI